MSKWFLLIILFVGFLCVGCVCGAEVSVDVDCKHVIGSGLGNVPFDLETCVNVVYVIGVVNESNGCVVEEYPVSVEDYYKISIGDKVVLGVPDSRLRVCKVVSVEH